MESQHFPASGAQVVDEYSWIVGDHPRAGERKEARESRLR